MAPTAWPAGWLSAARLEDREEAEEFLIGNGVNGERGAMTEPTPGSTDQDSESSTRTTILPMCQELQRSPSAHKVSHRRAAANNYVYGSVAILTGLALLVTLVFDVPNLQRDSTQHCRSEKNPWRGWDRVEEMFIFGDSYIDTRFDPSADQPKSTNPMGNPPFPGTTSCRGPDWVDYLVNKYNQSFVKAYNLAWGGTTINWDLVGGFPISPDFRHQISDTFIPHYVEDPLASWMPATSLFAVFFGINDISNSYHKGNKTVHALIFQTYATLMNQLYDAGARNFVLFNVPPMNLSPETVADGTEAQDLEAQAIQDFNARLAQSAKHMRSAHLNVTVFEIDTNSLFSRALRDPSSFPQTSEYKNTTDFCVAYDIGKNRSEPYLEECWIPVEEYF